MPDTSNHRYYDYNDNGSIWIDRVWAIDRLVEKYHIELMNMNDERIVEEYVDKFGDPNRP